MCKIINIIKEYIDINTVIIIVTFLLVLLGISFFINKKKDLLRSHIKYKNTIISI